MNETSNTEANSVITITTSEPNIVPLNTIQEIYNHELTRYTSKWSHYFDIYEQYLSKFRDKNPVVVEIGVDNGGSLEMWKKYFGPNSMVIGIDNRPKVTEIEGCNIVFGDQGNEVFWENFVAACPHVDIVIDDGSHYMAHQILTFEKLFAHMNQGGVYICEDTHSSYWNDKIGNPPSAWGGGLFMEQTFIEYSKKLVDVLHDDHIPRESPDFAYLRPLLSQYRSVKCVHFYDSMVVVEKQNREKAFVTYTNRDRAI
jgi:hypothetical protein